MSYGACRQPMAARRRWLQAILVVPLVCALLCGGFSAPLYAQDGPAQDPSPLAPASVDAPTAPEQSLTAKIYPSRDVFIASNQPNLNTANFSNLDVGWFGNYGATRTMIQFNMSSVPSNVHVYSAKLYMNLQQALPPNDAQMRLAGAQITQSWSETWPTWNNSAGLGPNQFTLGSIGTNPGWVSFNVTGLVQGWVSGQTNNGLMIYGDETPSTSRSRVFWSRNSQESPYLLVNYDCDTWAPQTSMIAQPQQYEPGAFVAYWGGKDVAPPNCTPSGIRKFAVDYRINGQAWQQWKSTTLTSFTFDNFASNGDRVDFREYASDNAGNVEAVPSSPQWSVTIDTVPPVVTLAPLPQYTPYANFQVAWSGTDNLSGVKNYSVQYQINGGAWQPLVTNSTATSAQVTGAQNAQIIGFRAIGTDNVGNVGTWPSSAQVWTTIALYPTANVLPFNPGIIKPTSPVTTSFAVYWTGYTVPNTTIVQYQIYYRYTDMNGLTTGWRTWNTFPGTQTSASFPFPQLGLGDGLYDFEATATNNLGQTTPATGTPEASMIVDLGNQVQPAQFLPWLSVN